MNLHKEIISKWNNIIEEQQYNIAAQTSHNLVKKNWESNEQFNKRIFYYEFENNKKIIKAFERIIKYGYPKKCPAIKHITNLLIF